VCPKKRKFRDLSQARTKGQITERVGGNARLSVGEKGTRVQLAPESESACLTGEYAPEGRKKNGGHLAGFSVSWVGLSKMENGPKLRGTGNQQESGTGQRTIRSAGSESLTKGGSDSGTEG